MNRNHVIGYQQQIPWHLPADLKHFKNITMGKPIVMGRKTFASIGRPLPGRLNIIITGDTAYHAEGCRIVHSLDEAMRSLEKEPEIMIIGGASLYQQTLPMADKLYLTLIEEEFNGDTFFPAIDWSEWHELENEHHLPDAKNPYTYHFYIYERLA